MSDQYSFLQNDSTIADRLKNVYEKDFTIYFSSCSKKLKVNRILADLISPRIFKNHYTEGSNKEYQLNRNSEEIDFKIISFIFKNLKIPKKKEIEEIEEIKENKENNKNNQNNQNNHNSEKKEERNQQEKDKDFLIKILKLFKELGNEEVVKYLLEKEFKNREMNKELFKEIIEIEQSIKATREGEDKEYSIYKIIEYEEIKKYGANHFEEVKEIIKKLFSKNEMKEIIEEENFKIDSEYNLMKFIKEIISERGEEFKEMISYIKYEYLTNKEFEEYLEMIEPEEIETEEWQNLINKVMKFINKSQDNKLSHQNKAMIEISPKIGKEFEGIFDHLNKECNGNCATNQIINVTSSSLYQYGQKEEFLFDYSTLENGKWWNLNHELNGYLQIDFKDKRINLTHYSFHVFSCQEPKTWTIEGSNDLNSWDIVDSKKDDEYLKPGKELYHCYKCSKENKEAYRYIRIYQRGYSHNKDYHFLLTGLEFFGKLDIVKQ